MQRQWLWRRWPALLAVLLVLGGLELLSFPRFWHKLRDPERSVERAIPGVLAVRVTGSRMRCEGADAGVCSQTEQDAGTPPPEPLAGVQLQLLRVGVGVKAVQVEARTDAQGGAQLTAPRGSYWLLASLAGRTRRAEPVTLESGEQPLGLELAPALPFRITVLDETEHPLAGATVLLSEGDPFEERRETSALGVASFDSVGERVEGVRVSAPGFAPVVLQPVSREFSVHLSAPSSVRVHVLDPSGAVASAASVWLSGLDVWPPRRLEADADGNLDFTPLARGSYDLRAVLAANVASSSVTLERGQHVELTLQLVPGRSVAIRVSDADAPEQPVAGVAVVLVEDALGPFPLEGQTDAEGRVTLGPLPRGPATLSARAPGFMLESAVPVGADAAEVHVALTRAGHVRGRVLDPDGVPVEGATLEVVGNDIRGRPIARRALLDARDNVGSFGSQPLIPSGELGVLPGPLPTLTLLPDMSALPARPPGLSTTPTSAWVSDRDGNFWLDDVPPGQIRVIGRHARFVESTSEELRLTPAAEVVVRLVLVRGAALEGRLVDAGGQPVRQARIEALGRHSTQQASVFSRDDGGFTFSSVAPEVDLFVARPSDRYHFVLRRSLELEPGETRHLDLVLPAERAPLEIQVTGTDQRPIRSAMVSLLSLDPNSPARQSLLSDASGRTQLADAAGRALSLRVSAPGFAPFEVQLDAAPARLDVTLERAVSVIGRVTQVRGRQPLAGARIVLSQAGERRSTSSDERGEFHFPEASPGVAELSVSHRGFATRVERRTIRETGRSDRSFELDPIDLVEGGAVEGRVIDAAGAPVRGARVGVGLVPAFVPVGSEPAGLARSDAAGHFQLDGVAVGTVTLSAYAAGLGRGSLAEVEVRAGETSGPVEIQLGASNGTSESIGPASLAVTLGERSGASGSEVVIVDVAAGSEAERAGLRAGDVLRAVDGVDVDEMADARRRLSGNERSDVIIDLTRAGEALSINVRREAVRR